MTKNGKKNLEKKLDQLYRKKIIFDDEKQKKNN